MSVTKSQEMNVADLEFISDSQDSLKGATISLDGFLWGGYVLQLIFNLRSLVGMHKAFTNWITVVYLLTVYLSNAVHGLHSNLLCFFLNPGKEFYRIILLLMCIN